MNRIVECAIRTTEIDSESVSVGEKCDEIEMLIMIEIDDDDRLRSRIEIVGSGWK